MTDLRALLGDERFNAAMADLSLITSIKGLERRTLKIYADGWMAAMDTLLPDLLAAAWDEGYVASAIDANSGFATPNPYRSGDPR